MDVSGRTPAYIHFSGTLCPRLKAWDTKITNYKIIHIVDKVESTKKKEKSYSF